MDANKVKVLLIHSGDGGLGARLAALTRVDLLAVTADALQAVAAVRDRRPDVVILNADVPLADTLLIVHRLGQETPKVPALVLLPDNDERVLTALLDAGAAGCALSDITDKDFLYALHALARQESFLSPGLAKFLIENVQRSEETRKLH
ncbi:MAG: response regulator transcription factor [Armatimonadetes bacterium]|nr:response regulator transcription factor [Armatimonadota bacterium]